MLPAHTSATPDRQTDELLKPPLPKRFVAGGSWSEAAQSSRDAMDRGAASGASVVPHHPPLDCCFVRKNLLREQVVPKSERANQADLALEAAGLPHAGRSATSQGSEDDQGKLTKSP